MEQVAIVTDSKQYPVLIGPGVIKKLAGFIKEKFPKHTKVMIITDQTVANLHLSKLEDSLSSLDTVRITVPSGEEAKTFDVYQQCLTYALEQKLDRKSLVLAFGGGAVGDLGGFVAATFMRGIPFVQVPTTILAHDSAVGGKVAINHPLGKNMIGVFNQPEAVFYDLDFLNSLPLKERKSGFAEVIKHALIADLSFYEWLLKNIHSLESLDQEDLSYCLTKGIEIKGSIVAQDEKETGIRAYLNFGHTLGHAIEAEMGYGNYTHGEAVLIGMLFAIELSKKITGLDFNSVELKHWLKELGYETRLPDGINIHNLLSRMKMDKKAVGQKMNFVLLDQIGSPNMYEIEDAMIVECLDIFGYGED